MSGAKSLRPKAGHLNIALLCAEIPLSPASASPSSILQARLQKGRGKNPSQQCMPLVQAHPCAIKALAVFSLRGIQSLLSLMAMLKPVCSLFLCLLLSLCLYFLYLLSDSTLLRQIIPGINSHVTSQATVHGRSLWQHINKSKTK